MNRMHPGSLKVLMTLVLLLGIGRSPIWAINPVINLIVNPGFEDDGSAGVIPPFGWTRPTGTTFETSSEQVYGGGYSGKIYTSTSTARSSISTAFSVSSDSTYEWSVYIYDNNSTVKGYVKIFYYDSTGGALSNVSLGTASGDNSIWQFRSGTIIALPDARTARLRCYIDGVGSGPYDGAVYFDDVSFGLAPVPPTITTLDPTNITASSCTLRCTYTVGGVSMVTVYFQEKNGENWFIIAGSETERAGSGSHKFLFSGLIAGRTYTIRAGLTYDSGARTIYGAEKTFSTNITAVNHVVINEFYGHPNFGTGREWIEFYNPTDHLVNISGWTLWRTSGYTPASSPEFTIPNGTYLCPDSSFLVTDAGWTTGDNPKDGHPEWPIGNFEDDMSIIDTRGAIKLCNSDMVTVDAVGWGDVDPEFCEGNFLSPATLQQGKSWERINHCDTDDNTNDFQLLDSPTPTRSTTCYPEDVDNNDFKENPQNLSLSVFPNPFNASVAISYEISNSGSVGLNIYNLQGQLVKTLIDEEQKIGNYNITWDGTDKNNQIVPSGVYFCKLQQKSQTKIKRLIFLK